VLRNGKHAEEQDEVEESQSSPGASSVNGKDKFKTIIVAVGELIDGDGRSTIARFRIGDLLIVIVGKIGPHGAHNRSHELLRQIAKAIAEAYGDRAKRYGYEFLKQLRSVASRFPEGTRVPSEPWVVHRIAGNPKTLNGALDWAKHSGRKQPLTEHFVRKYKRHLQSEEAKVAGKRDPKAVLALDEFERAGVDLIDKGDAALLLLKANIQFFTAKDRTERCDRLVTIQSKVNDRFTAIIRTLRGEAA
jgi:hypothetical protein